MKSETEFAIKMKALAKFSLILIIIGFGLPQKSPQLQLKNSDESGIDFINEIGAANEFNV